MPKDLFSKQADAYAKYRPTYPQELTDYILSFVNTYEAAWDCATGNGQAALLLAPHFKKIFATDISEKQIQNAVCTPNIFYSTGSAEQTNFEENSFDLITMAQAYHWMRFDEFYKEATRVGKPACVVAIWGYGLVVSSDEKLNELIRYFYVDVIGKYWDTERKYVDERYNTVPFAFERLPSREFSINVKWNMEDFKGYLNTWSSVQHFIKTNKYNPVDEFSFKLEALQKRDEEISFSFPVFLLLGRIVK
ncbi:MAG: class I SAM-dependent methyltransferase [Bacteroidetes bacterium]|nr:class I SAM-dependent methyltransferase [Bacteroidota bacterium]